MRPSLLTISAWGPYPEKVAIDFTKFEEGSVFLITGPTGAGKTTIFDAISYALYGNVSGMNRDKATVRSDFAAPDADTYVDLTFTHKGKTYQIYRTPKYERPKKRGEGYTTSAETAVLKMEGEAPIASIQEVNRKVEEIMGINYEQFKQIAMIAQGEFLSLLYAKSEDKVEIFRNLFKTQIYDRMLKSLTERSKNLYNRMKEHTNKMDEAIAGIDCGKNEELLELTRMEHKNYEKIIELLKAEIHASEGKAKACKEEFLKIEDIYSQQLNKISVATELNRNIEQLDQTKEILATLLQKKDEMEATKVQLTQARLAQGVEVHEKLYLEADRRQQQWKEKVAETSEALHRLKEEFAQLEQELVHAKQLEEMIETCKQQVQWLESLLPLLKSLEEKEQQQKQLAKRLEVTTAKELQFKSEQQMYKDERLKLTETMKTYETVDAKLGEIKLQIEQAKQTYESLQQALKMLDQIQKEEALLRSVQQQYLLQETKLKEVKERYETKERLYRQAAVGLAARFLEDNQPCPVCGSLEHPNKAVISHEVPDENELEKEKRIYEQEQKVYNGIYNQASSMSGALESKREELSRMTQLLGIDDYSGLVHAFNSIKEKSLKLIAQRKQLEATQIEKEQCSQSLKECERKLEEITAAMESVSEEKNNAQREKDVITGSIANLKLQLPKEYSEINKVELELSEGRLKIQKLSQVNEQIQRKKEQLYAKKESIEALLESHKLQLQESSTEAAKKKVAFEASITEVGFKDMNDYQEAKLPADAMMHKGQAVERYTEKLTSCQEQEKQLALRIGGQKKAEIDSLNQELAVITENKRKLQASSEEMAANLVCNRRALESLKEKMTKISDLSLTFGYVKDLENAAKGVNSERIVFEHYVLAAYFEDILVAANLRLSAMTNSRYELLKVSKVNDQRTKNSLDLEVLDQYTGKRRSVKTLSGGESFKAALSLALGLSDIIQQNAGGIEIDTLFIDEGFGSLDSESLDQALKTLTTLTGQNKLIGIISHVSELKERVDNQIMIEKDHSGSKLKVVC